MCTISWGFDKQSLNIVINRDETKQRAIAHAPQIVTYQGVQSIMPVDPDSGGSWVAVNQAGFTLCILNHTACKRRQPPTRSRGALLKDLAACTDWSTLDGLLQTSKLTPYAPFQLLVFAQLSAPILYIWDQQCLKVNQQVPSAVSTSSLWPSWVPRARTRWLKRNRERHDLDTLLAQHLAAKPFGSKVGVFMHRGNARTVSITSLQLSAQDATMRYADVVNNSPVAQQTLVFSSSGAALPQSTHTVLSVKELIQKYRPQLAMRMHRYQWHLLRGLLQEARLNKLLAEYSGYAAEQFFDQVARNLELTTQVSFWRLPAPSERPVFVCNHPSGGIDGIIALAFLLPRYPDLRVVANDALGIIPHIRERLVPINIFGQPRASVQTLQRAFRGNQPLLIFAAGKTARNIQGRLDDGLWSASIATLARRYRRPLVPSYIDTRNSRMFYALHWLRQKLHIGVNLEMFLLPRELLKPTQKRVGLFFDIPVTVHELQALAPFDNDRMAAIKKRAYRLPEQFNQGNYDQAKTTCGRSA